MISHLLSLLLLIAAPQDRTAKTDTTATTPARRVIASTSEWSITAGDFDAILKTFPEQDRLRYTDPQYRRGLVNELVRIWVLCAEARKNGIDVARDYESQRNYYQKLGRDIRAT